MVKLIEVMKEAGITEEMWPVECPFAAQDENCKVYVYVDLPDSPKTMLEGVVQWRYSSDDFLYVGKLKRAEDWQTTIISREDFFK